MGSAENINLDCLELIFAYLSGNDLVSVSLVSRTFLAGVIPLLYRSLVYHLGNAKRYPKIISPFATVIEHPNLAVHVRNIDIRTVPMMKCTVQPQFMNDCARTLVLCKHLGSFTCTPNVLPSFLLSLQGKVCLENIRINGMLTTAQAEKLVDLHGLRSLTLDGGTWNMVDQLPKWTSSLQPSLTSLTLYAINELNETVLAAVLTNLTKLTALHVIGCMKVDHNAVLRLVSNTPGLESLSFTTWESPSPVNPFSLALSKLRHLTIDTRCTLSPNATPAAWHSLIRLTRLWGCHLTSITLKLSERLLVADTFIKELLDAHAISLKYIAFLNCALAHSGLRLIASKCKALERMAMNVPAKDFYQFSEALSRAPKLHTLIDIGNSHANHANRAFLSRDNVRTIMELVPQLTKVITDGRVWQGHKPQYWVDEGFKLTLERRKNPCPTHWFMPPS